MGYNTVLFGNLLAAYHSSFVFVFRVVKEHLSFSGELVALCRKTAGSTISVAGKQKKRRYGLPRAIFIHPHNTSSPIGLLQTLLVVLFLI